MNDQCYFDEYYYHYTGFNSPYVRNQQWMNFFMHVAEQITQRLRPQTVIDVGCAKGFLVEAFRRQGVKAFGFDLSEYAIREAHPEAKPYLWVASLVDPFPQRFDLVTCIEVVEHLPAQYAYQAIRNLCLASDDIIFSSTPFGFKEASHLNVRPPEFWGELFALQGFTRDVNFDCSFISYWAARYRRDQRQQNEILRDYERHFWSLKEENIALRESLLEANALRAQLQSRLDEVQSETSPDSVPSKSQQALADNEALELQQLQERLAAITSELESTKLALQSILDSRAWRLVQRLQCLRLRFVPPGSRRESWWRRLLDLLF